MLDSQARGGPAGQRPETQAGRGEQGGPETDGASWWTASEPGGPPPAGEGTPGQDAPAVAGVKLRTFQDQQLLVCECCAR